MLVKRGPKWLYHCLLAIALVTVFVVVIAVGAKKFSSKFIDVDVYDDGEFFQVRTMGSSVGDILEEANIEITENDYINVKQDENVSETNDKIYIKRAVPVIINVDGKEQKVYTLQENVSGVLEENNITLSSLDRINNVSLTSEITRDMEISIVRVTDEIVTEDINIPYQVLRKENDDMSIGDEKIVNDGEVGKRTKTYRVLYEDGNQVGKELIKDQVSKQPINKVVEYGIVETFSTSRGAKVQFAEAYDMSATAYTMAGLTNRSKDHPQWGITASGMKAQVGVIAVDRNVIPLGTKLYVESLSSKFPDYGYAIAGDVGGFRGNHVDLYYNTLSECYKWGNRNVRVYVLRNQNVDIFELRE